MRVQILNTYILDLLLSIHKLNMHLRNTDNGVLSADAIKFTAFSKAKVDESRRVSILQLCISVYLPGFNLGQSLNIVGGYLLEVATGKCWRLEAVTSVLIM